MLARALAVSLAAVSAFAQEPPQDPLARLEEQLAEHPFFARIAWTREDSVERFVFYVQRPPKPEDGYEARIAQKYAAYVAPLVEHFEQRYAAPLGGPLPIVVLATAGDAQTFVQLSKGLAHYRCAYFYDAELRVPVVFERPFQPGVTPDEERRSARHVATHGLLQAHFAGEGAFPQETWLAEGLADYLASCGDAEDGSLLAPAVNPEILRKLIAATRDPNGRALHWRPVPELVAIESFDHLTSRVQFVAKQRGVEAEPTLPETYYCYWRASRLFVQYLHREEHRAGFEELVAATLRGEPALASFRSHVGDAAALDRAFEDWLASEHRRLFPDEAPPSSAEDAAPSAPSASAPARPAFSPASLRVADPVPELRFAAALCTARSGRTGAALATVDELLALELEPALRERVERERMRLASWNDLRSAWLARLATSGEALRFEHGGRTVRARVAEVADGVVRFAGDGEPSELPLDELDALALARQMGKDGDELAARWVRMYPYVLSADPAWQRLLRGRGDEAVALERDGESDYPARFAQGEVLAALDDLARTEPPADAASAEALLASIDAFVAAHGAAEAARAKLPELRAFASVAWAAILDERGPGALLAGSLETLEDGRVRLAYEFESAGELDDFGPAEDLAVMSARFGPLGRDEEGFRVAHGELVGVGRAGLRHVLEFAAPLRIRYDLTYGDFGPDDSYDYFFVVGICDSGDGRWVRSINAVDLEIGDGRSLNLVHGEKRPPRFDRVEYEMELEHDGAEVWSLFAGGEMHRVPCPRLTSGGLTLYLHSQISIRLERLAIEGTITPASLERLRAEWIGDRVAKIGS